MDFSCESRFNCMKPTSNNKISTFDKRNIFFILKISNLIFSPQQKMKHYIVLLRYLYELKIELFFLYS